MFFVIKGHRGKLLIVAILLIGLFGLVNSHRGEIRCGSIDIRNSPYFGTNLNVAAKNDLECTIVEGDFTLSMMTEDTISDEMFPVFYNLREITGALLVFQIRGLTSLGKIFPNLRVIGGYSLIMNYALVIYQNQDLRNVGLSKLAIIKNGGIRIAENSRLCYTRNINWDNMIVGNLRDVILDTAESQCQDQCNVVNESKCHRPRPNVISCWNSTECQSFCPHYKFDNGTFGPGCDENGEMCHEFCLGGCSAPNDPGACHTCRYVEIHGICASACPETMFEQLGRRCLTKEQCHNQKPMHGTISANEAVWKAFDRKCHYDCPSGYEEDPNDSRNCVKCIGHCPKKCRGDENIDSAGAALKFRDCNIIDGYLEIEIRIGNEANAEKFSEAFGEVEEITGYLMIRFSSVFVSLHMFKKLRIIHGNQLSRNVYSLVVFDNQNLRELFNLKRQALSIPRGKVQFQNNRMLCYKKIEAFLNHIGKLNDVTDVDVSTYSNGDKAVCDEVPLDVEIVAVYADSFLIRWTPFNTSDMDYRKFIGYQIFYKKVDRIDEDISIDEDRSACADTWKMQFVDSVQNDGSIEEITGKGQQGQSGEIISQGIEPNTIYAFYVQTRIVNHPGARNAISKVHFVTTHFGNPDPPRIRVYRARGPDRVEVRWDPPLSPQGVITHYTIQWQPPEQTENYEELNGCVDEVQKSPVETLSKQAKKPGTCSIQEGCCDCSLLNRSALLRTPEESISNPAEIFTEEMELSREERDAFENAIQNKVFVQKNNKNSRSKRQVMSDDVAMDPAVVQEIINKNETAFNISVLNVSDPTFPADFRTQGKINITGDRVLLTGLPHFTEYVILIYACQDINEPDNSCSARPAWVTVRTSALPQNDKVNVSTIEIRNATNSKETDKHIYWEKPEHPNGVVLAYRVKLYRGSSDGTPLYKCVNISQFEKDEGVKFSGLAGGTYSLEISTVTLAGVGEPVRYEEFFKVHNPMFTKRAMTIAGICLLIGFIILGAIIYFVFKYYCHKISEEKVHQLLSTNPEYLSQIDVYKKDEWELPRAALALGNEIGSGTFGKVFRGIGQDLTAVNGATFGECAIKTISKKNANMDRYHFLIEASVMKQFNTNFIVKLYGVVSDEPVLVVMELMEKGNLRDFLRAHRPGSEENANTRYTLPSAQQYYLWAAQIADGMAYLENLRFCHRDLAARNCMVANDETVKIGDFGMARDIYYHEYYKPQGRRLMPIRWLSPESLKDGKFTLKSDIWAFGVVLYEMLTLGQQPYAGLANNQVFNYVCIQHRVMARPKNCPDSWYNMMRACWMYETRDRPCFWQIVDYLKDQTNNEEFNQLSFVYNDASVKRTEGPYNFNRDWPSNGSSNDESEEDEYEDERTTQYEHRHHHAHSDRDSKDKFKIQMDKESNMEDSYVKSNDVNVQDYTDSCSCSECSDHEEEHYMDPLQRRNVRNFLNSIAIPAQKKDDMKKSKERDLECLLPQDNQTDEEEYVAGPSRIAMSDSFGGQSTASTSQTDQTGRNRPSISETEKDAIRRALDGIQTKDISEIAWPNDNKKIEEPADEYVMTGEESFDQESDALVPKQSVGSRSNKKEN